MITVPLHRHQFSERTITITKGRGIAVRALRYPSGIESLRLENGRGYVEVLPFMGQIIWDAEFDGTSLRMTNMFSQPKPCQEIVDTYGCFAFHSGLLAAGCPSPEDDHVLHGEFPCSTMDDAWLEIDDDGAVRIVSSYEYVQGFGHHYRAVPHVELRPGSSMFDIGMEITNLSKYAPMPLQYMCHMNYAFVENGVMTETLPAGAFKLRTTVPAHVHPTPRWSELNEQILDGRIDGSSLAYAKEFDPEIVFFADDLPQYGEHLGFELAGENGVVFRTEFDSSQFPVATRWVLYNADQQVAAFVLPGTSRPEGFLAAKEAGTLIELAAGETRKFIVTTGIKE
ncbi:aldose 1-epimerase family protein [Arcanobacterium phocae]|uniref:aldose 1-epimerase family protein n=1 Tax=Arcanobacterium phocae TaxID=131112 RepID=UPI001C0F05F9|nr:aldose 1-epimerase family protein [Arcanobacterium phocae]